MGPTVAKSRYVADVLDCGRDTTEYFADKDLVIGAVINAYGRRVILTDCDNFTKEYYRVKYGLGMIFHHYYINLLFGRIITISIVIINYFLFFDIVEVHHVGM